MSRLIKNLQLIIRIESLPTLNRRMTDMGLLLRDILVSFEQAGRQPGVMLEAGADVPLIPVDAALLHDALWQVVDNALRYTPADGRITVRTACSTQYAMIIVQDSGTGIPEQAMPHIFESFYRFDESHTTPGFGLGLPIARLIIEQHQGSINVESVLGVGTTVTILLPLQG
jgi:signal transduction histidine kinase